MALVIGSLGWAAERTLIKPLYGGNLNDLLLLSLGLTSVIIEIVKLIWGRWGLPFHPSDALEGWINLGFILFSKYLIALGLLVRPRGCWPKGACWSATHPPTADPRCGACLFPVVVPYTALAGWNIPPPAISRRERQKRDSAATGRLTRRRRTPTMAFSTVDGFIARFSYRPRMRPMSWRLRRWIWLAQGTTLWSSAMAR
jgi:hypothetical protein